jgi:hypothetical protein
MQNIYKEKPILPKENRSSIYISHIDSFFSTHKVSLFEVDQVQRPVSLEINHVTEFIEGLDSYETLDWNTLKVDIRKEVKY